MPLDLSGNGILSGVDIAGSGLGKILQIVRATDSTNRTTTSTSYVDVTNMSVTITPQKSDSAVLVLATCEVTAVCTSPGNSPAARYQLTDSSNNALSGAEGTLLNVYLFNTNDEITCGMTLLGRSTPATTSAVTYKMRFRADGGRRAQVNNANVTGQIYAIEVSA